MRHSVYVQRRTTFHLLLENNGNIPGIHILVQLDYQIIQFFAHLVNQGVASSDDQLYTYSYHPDMIEVPLSRAICDALIPKERVVPSIVLPHHHV